MCVSMRPKNGELFSKKSPIIFVLQDFKRGSLYNYNNYGE